MAPTNAIRAMILLCFLSFLYDFYTLLVDDDPSDIASIFTVITSIIMGPINTAYHPLPAIGNSILTLVIVLTIWMHVLVYDSSYATVALLAVATAIFTPMFDYFCVSLASNAQFQEAGEEMWQAMREAVPDNVTSLPAKGLDSLNAWKETLWSSDEDNMTLPVSESDIRPETTTKETPPKCEEP
ncbi:hypothetical protein HGRIS_008674 [Hohenbuehelia grisea]|uniref:Uncharacterized protein n=1 Tax=Hohenbuehelia grisea TaxID=104357 RepID=A0ABR3J8Q8_9AGAR